MTSNVEVRGDGPALPARRPSGEAAPRLQGYAWDAEFFSEASISLNNTHIALAQGLSFQQFGQEDRWGLSGLIGELPSIFLRMPLFRLASL